MTSRTRVFKNKYSMITDAISKIKHSTVFAPIKPESKYPSSPCLYCYLYQIVINSSYSPYRSYWSHLTDIVLMSSISSYNHHLQSCYLQNQTFRINCISRKIQILKIHHAIEKSTITNELDSLISHSSFYPLFSFRTSTVKRHMSDRIQIVLAEGAEQNLNSLVTNSVPS